MAVNFTLESLSFDELCTFPLNSSTFFPCDASSSSHASSNYSTSNLTLEEELEQFVSRMRDEVRPELYIYSTLFIVGATANLYVLYHLLLDKFKSRMNYLIKHLTIADLMVIFVTISIEIVWRLTISWEAGQLGCKLIMFLRAFGLYLASAMVICISLDRYYAFVHPLSVLTVEARNKYFLITSYIVSFIASIPQAIVFHVRYHPRFGTLFGQCQTSGFFSNKLIEQLYSILSLMMMYFAPLMFIIFCYAFILRNLHSAAELSSHLQESADNPPSAANGSATSNLDSSPVPVVSSQSGLRTALMARAKRRTLKLTIAIVTAFIMCWTPYAVILFWDLLDRPSLTSMVPSWLKDVCFVFAVTNSCVNPFVHSHQIIVKGMGMGMGFRVPCTRVKSRAPVCAVTVTDVNGLSVLETQV